MRCSRPATARSLNFWAGARSRAVLDRFAHAIQTQDKAAPIEQVAEHASWTSDRDDHPRAASKVIRGRDRVACFVLGVLGRQAHELALEAASVNGEPALAVGATGRLIFVIKMRTDGIRILDVYAELNPDKRTGGAAPRG